MKFNILSKDYSIQMTVEASNLLELKDKVYPNVSKFRKSFKFDVNSNFKDKKNSQSKAINLRDDECLETYLKDQFNPSLSNPVQLLYKDLGPQVNYQLVYIVEYFLPLTIICFILFYMLYTIGIEIDSTSSIYETIKTGYQLLWSEYSGINRFKFIAMILYSFHFIKRIFESIFVHTYSHSTMPLFNLVKNSSLYGLSGLCVGLELLFKDPSPHNYIYLNSNQGHTFSFTDLFGQFSFYLMFICLFFLFELLNGIVHLQLRFLRSSVDPKNVKGINKLSVTHPIPSNLFLFKICSCPNYLFEVLLWLSFAMFTHSIFTLVFITLGTLQMIQWAKKKHIRYIETAKKMDKEYQIKYAMIPFLI